MTNENRPLADDFRVITFAEKKIAMVKNRTIAVILVILNVVVLLGQIWPAGAPPFARVVNIIFLCLSLVYFLSTLFLAKR
ncbi:MAG: hypothetical protein ACM3ME_02480 [Chloroflexota bacterium]